MKTLIVGGGLSGLVLASRLEELGHDYHLIEARDRFGGRVRSAQSDGAAFDLGPAWFWPGQPRIAALIARLGLETFEQYHHGDQLFEDVGGQVQRARGFASVQGSFRLSGGTGALTSGLADSIPDKRRQLNAPLTSLTYGRTGIVAEVSGGGAVSADHVVFAMPPRMVADIAFQPDLPPEAVAAMRSAPTWMAGQAKVVAVYDTPFWRDAGLSGDVTSRRGPMVELHDASPARCGPFGLFGFVGVPPQGRTDDAALKHASVAQLVRLFGPQAANPRALFLKDWAVDARTSTPLDLAPLYAHPTYSLPSSMAELWQYGIGFAGTEVAPEFGGYLEGALEAADNALGKILALPQ